MKPVKMYGSVPESQIAEDYERLYGKGPRVWAGKPIGKRRRWQK